VLEVGLSAVVGLSTLLGWWFYLHYHVNGGGGDRGPHPVEFYRIKAACGSHKKKGGILKVCRGKYIPMPHTHLEERGVGIWKGVSRGAK
jgi:hypothetical protein